MTKTNRDLTKREQDIAEGSVFDVAYRQNKPPEAVLAGAEAVILFDNSGSMGHQIDAEGSRFDHAVTALRNIQRKYDGQIVLIVFNSAPQLEFTGVPQPPQGQTNLTGALEMAQELDGLGLKFIVISDGYPNNQHSALRTAERFEDPISTIFIGSDTDSSALEFMKKLANTTGGTDMGRQDVHLLEDKIAGLLGPSSG